MSATRPRRSKFRRRGKAETSGVASVIQFDDSNHLFHAQVSFLSVQVEKTLWLQFMFPASETL
jgi:hypothetical protein